MQGKKHYWRRSKLDRAHLLVDAAAYFDDLCKTLPKARKTVYLVGWDFDTRVKLRPGEEDEVRVLDLLKDITERNPNLEVCILVWHASVFYGYDREKFSRLKIQQSLPDRVHLAFDKEYPLTGSHHQKFLVIDDSVAYCGGMDVTHHRWDTSEHLPQDQRRTLPNDKQFGPYHDVEIRVGGSVAKDLGDLFRLRWKQAKLSELAAPKPAPATTWDELPWELPATACAISRTFPSFKDQPEVQETYHLYLKLISEAKQHIFIENQYLTSKPITEALAKRLREKDGPFVTVILPKKMVEGPGNYMMKQHRKACLWALREADHFGRFCAGAPMVGGDVSVYVHTKCLFIDDTSLVIGSSNLSARSMGLDTECDLWIQADTAEARSTLRSWRCRLLAEHMDQEPGDVAEHLPERRGDLHDCLEKQAGATRRLEILSIERPTAFQNFLTKNELTDYQQPLLFDALVDSLRQTILRNERSGLLWSILTVGALVGLLVLAVFIASQTPLQGWIDEVLNSTVLQGIQNIGFGPVWMPLFFVLIGIICVPMNVVMLATATVFRAEWALLYIISGMMLSAATNYGIGRIVGKTYLEKIFPKGVKKISDTFDHKEFGASAIVRMVPIAPFGVINYLAGAYHITLLPFLAGTLVGILPGTVLLVFFQRTLLQTIANPTPFNLAFLGFYGLILFGLGRFFTKRL